MKHFYLYVTYRTKPGCREAFVREVTESGALAAIREENGCVRYDYFYSAEDPDLLLLIEEWESEAHQQTHIGQPHMKKVMAAKERFAEKVELGRFFL